MPRMKKATNPKCASAGINHYAHEPKYAWRDTQEEPLYEFETHLELTGTCTHPEERAGDIYELTIYGDVSPQSGIYWKLKDVQVVDQNHVRQYRTYRVVGISQVEVPQT